MSHTTPEAQAADLKLVVCDMDGTLLDGRGEIPQELWPLLETMRHRGIAFTPASGRQYATLESMFGSAATGSGTDDGTSGPDSDNDAGTGSTDGMAFIAENGAQLMRNGVLLAASVIDPDYVTATLDRLDRLVAEGQNIGVVLSGTTVARVRRHDDAFLAEVRKYYHQLEVVDDLSGIGNVIKMAVYDFGDASTVVHPRLHEAAQGHSVVLSARHWVDVSNARATKGHALAQLQQALGVTPAQTAVFGDYLNDLDMFDHAQLSFAMANAHPDLLARARFTAPSNLEGGVITTLSHLLVNH